MPSRIFPSTALEQIDIDLCKLEHMVYALQNKGGGGFPIYDERQLPRDIIEGQAFLTEQGRFCVRYGDSIFCMPSAPRPSGVSYPLYSAQVECIPSYNSGFSRGMFRIAICDEGGERYIARDDDLHKVTPIWNSDFTRIIYQEICSRVTAAPETTTKLCTMKPDGTDRIVIDDSGISAKNHPFQTYYYRDYCPSPDNEKIAIVDTQNRLRCVWADGSGPTHSLDPEGQLSSIPYGNPQWSADSTTIYIETIYGISAFTFDQSPPYSWVVYYPDDTDWFWINNTHDRFCTNWNTAGPEQEAFQIINLDGVAEYQYTETDLPWFNDYGTYGAVATYWSLDGNYVFLDWQYVPPFYDEFPGRESDGNQYAVVMTTPDLSDWKILSFTDPDVGAVANYRNIHNTSLAYVDGKVQVVGAVWNTNLDGNGGGIAAIDIETGECSWVATSAWGSGGLETVWERYNVGGLSTCTGFFGTQPFDI